METAEEYILKIDGKNKYFLVDELIKVLNRWKRKRGISYEFIRKID